MTAALAASISGRCVMLCEATQQVGGTTATSAGTLWIPGNRQAQADGHADSAADVADAARYLNALVGRDDPHDLRRTFLEQAAAVLAELEQRTRLRFVNAGLHPDYVQAPGAAQAGRALSPVEFDGRCLGRQDFARVRPPLPELLVLGGMMANKADVQALFTRWRRWAGFTRSARLVTRYLVDRLRYPRGTRLVLGNALAARLLASLRDAGVDIRFGHRLLHLTEQQGAVTGAVFEVAGVRRAVHARCGVILATGGIGHDTRLRAQLAAEVHPHSLACASVRGEGLAAARGVGAQLQRFTNDFLWQPVSCVPRADGSVGLFPHLYLDRAKPGLIAVDGRGRRFVDEGASYHHFVEAQCRVQAAVAPAWLVCDSRFVHSYGLGVVPPGAAPAARVSDGYLTAADSLPVLAARIGVDADTLAATVNRHNAAAVSGKDGEFGKGESPLSRFNGDASHFPNPCLGEIARPPFYAVAVQAADAASCSGLATNADGAVLRADGRVISGLYACGNDMASPFRGAYPGPGGDAGPRARLRLACRPACGDAEPGRHSALGQRRGRAGTCMGCRMKHAPQGPLVGLRVVEFAGLGPAPFACMLLSDMGADVVTVDCPGSRLGDRSNLAGRGRTVVQADLKQPAARAEVLRLIDRADVLVEGFRPGVMERLGLGPEVTAARNPRLIYGRMTGWGQHGPLAHTAGHDIGYIALSGALHAIGPAGGPPVPPLNIVGDYGGGSLFLVTGILAALHDRQRSGLGQVVDTAITDGVLSLMTHFAASSLRGSFDETRRGSNPLDGGAPYYAVYETADGRHVAVGAIEPAFFALLCERIGVAPELRDAQNDRARWPALHAELTRLFAQRSRADWQHLLEDSDACFAAVLTLSEAAAHPHHSARTAFVDVDGVRQPAPAPRFSRTPSAVQGPAPSQATPVAEVLAQWAPGPPHALR